MEGHSPRWQPVLAAIPRSCERCGKSRPSLLDGWRVSHGAFDPTLLAPLVGLGYAASWQDSAKVTSLPGNARPRTALDELLIDGNVVVAPAGTCLDPGGIGKGLAADLVARRLLEAGARGASVSIGGDVSVRGAAPQPEGWRHVDRELGPGGRGPGGT